MSTLTTTPATDDFSANHDADWLLHEINLVNTPSESWCTQPLLTPYGNAYLVGRYLHALDWHMMREALWFCPRCKEMISTLLGRIVATAAQITFPINTDIPPATEECRRRWLTWRSSEEFQFWGEHFSEERFDPARWDDEFTRDILRAVKDSVHWREVQQIESLLELGRWVDRGLRPLGISWLWPEDNAAQPDSLSLAFQGIVNPTGSRPSHSWLAAVQRAATDAEVKLNDSLWASDAEVPLVVARIDTQIRAELEQKYERCHGRQHDSVRPYWDKERRKLWFRGRMVRQFLREAKNQSKILAAFEESGWPEFVDDPLYDDEKNKKRKGKQKKIQVPQRRLNETMKGLNKNIDGLRFFGDGTGMRIGWKPVAAVAASMSKVCQQRLESGPLLREKGPARATGGLLARVCGGGEG